MTETMSRASAQRLVAKSLMTQAGAILDRKGHDYAKDHDAFSNFKFSGMMLDWAVQSGMCGGDLGFLGLISTKLARLMELYGQGKMPANEAAADSFQDLINYCALWGAYHLCPADAEQEHLEDTYSPVVELMDVGDLYEGDDD